MFTTLVDFDWTFFKTMYIQWAKPGRDKQGGGIGGGEWWEWGKEADGGGLTGTGRPLTQKCQL